MPTIRPDLAPPALHSPPKADITHDYNTYLKRWASAGASLKGQNNYHGQKAWEEIARHFAFDIVLGCYVTGFSRCRITGTQGEPHGTALALKCCLWLSKWWLRGRPEQQVVTHQLEGSPPAEPGSPPGALSLSRFRFLPGSANKKLGLWGTWLVRHNISLLGCAWVTCSLGFHVPKNLPWFDWVWSKIQSQTRVLLARCDV